MVLVASFTSRSILTKPAKVNVELSGSSVRLRVEGGQMGGKEVALESHNPATGKAATNYVLVFLGHHMRRQQVILEITVRDLLRFRHSASAGNV